jgi:hypothetical protein
MDEQSQQILAISLANYVSNGLLVYLGPQIKKLVLQNFLSTEKIRPNLPYYIVPTKKSLAQQNVITGMSKTLQKVKNYKSNLELANKHCLISATIHEGPSSSMSGITRVLGLHPRNIVNALERRRVANNSSIPLW